jgi:hypothetical protein
MDGGLPSVLLGFFRTLAGETGFSFRLVFLAEDEPAFILISAGQARRRACGFRPASGGEK